MCHSDMQAVKHQIQHRWTFVQVVEHDYRALAILLSESVL